MTVSETVTTGCITLVTVVVVDEEDVVVVVATALFFFFIWMFLFANEVNVHSRLASSCLHLNSYLVDN
jgi:hypothetical protein